MTAVLTKLGNIEGVRGRAFIVPPLQSSDLFLLSSIMQTIGAIWGIVFVVYVFISEYYLRGPDNEGRTITQHLVWAAGFEQEQSQKQQLAGSNISDVLNSDLHHIQELRNAVARNYRVFRRIIFVGLLVGTSIIVDLVIIWSNDASYLGLAVWTFIASLVLLGYVLLWEVWTTFLRSARLLRSMDKAAREGHTAYQDTLKNQPPKKNA